MGRSGRFGIFPLAESLNVLSEIAAMVKSVEGHIEVAINNEYGLSRHGGQTWSSGAGVGTSDRPQRSFSFQIYEKLKAE